MVRLIIALWALLLAQACSQSETAVDKDTTSVVAARTVVIQPGSWVHNFKSYGLVKPAEEYEIGVEVSSTVEDVLFREGDAVRAGDMLLQLDDRRLKLRLESARASVEEAVAAHEQARSTHERNESIYQSGVISEQSFLQSQSNLKSAAANLRRANSSLEMAREELSDARVTSPVTGVVTHRNVEVGKSVSPVDQLGIIRVLEALRVETFVSQKDINYVSVGMEALVTSPGAPGRVFSGRVDQVASSAEAATGNYEVGVVVEDAGSLLRDGMSAMVEFRTEMAEGVLSVPRAALVDRNRRLMVFRLEQGIARGVEPLLGIGNAEQVPVYSGLSGGDEIIISNLRLISDGQEIQRRNDTPEG